MSNKLALYVIGTLTMSMCAVVSVAIVAHSHANNLSLIFVSVMVGAALSQGIRAGFQIAHGVVDIDGAIRIMRISVMWSLCAMIMAYVVRL